MTNQRKLFHSSTYNFLYEIVRLAVWALANLAIPEDPSTYSNLCNNSVQYLGRQVHPPPHFQKEFTINVLRTIPT